MPMRRSSPECRCGLARWRYCTAKATPQGGWGFGMKAGIRRERSTTRAALSEPRHQGSCSLSVALVLGAEDSDQVRLLDRDDHVAAHQDCDEPQECHEPVAGDQAQRENL